MPIYGTMTSYYTLQRTTPYVLDPVTASGSGHSVNRQPPVPSSIQVKAAAAGTVVVAGVVDGSSVSETLTFMGAGYKATARRFTSVSSLTPGGAIIGTSLEAKATGPDGTPHPRLTSTVGTGIPGVYSPGAPKWAPHRESRMEQRSALILFDYRTDLEFRRGDFLLDENTGERFLVEGTLHLPTPTRPHHVEVHATLRDGEAPT